MVWTEALIIIGTPVARGVAGWFQKASADGKFTDLEYKKLIETVLRLGVPAAAIYYGFQLPIEIAVAAPIIADYVYSYAKKIVTAAKTKKKK